MALIKNNLPAFRIIPRAKTGLNPIKLAPGINEVDDNTWEEIKGFVEAEIKSSEIVVVTGSGKDGKGKTTALKDMNRDEAIAVIRATFYLPQLQAFKSSLTSEELRMECVNQIELVNKEAQNPKQTTEG